MGKGKRARQSGQSANASGNAEQESDLGQTINSIVSQTNATASSNTETGQLLKTLAIAIQHLGITMTKMNDTLERLNERLEHTESDLHDACLERDKLKVENGQLKKELGDVTTRLEVDTEMRERASRRCNIKIVGLGINSKPKLDVVDAVIKFHNDNSGAKLSKDDVVGVQVMKARRQDDQQKPSPDTAIITLRDADLKKGFYAAGKRMRDESQPVYVGDDLTPGQRKLIYELKKRSDLFNKVIFRNGVIKCFHKDGKGLRQFSYLHEMDKLPSAQPTTDL